MTQAERENAIGTWLRDVVLPRYTRPDYLDENTARAEVADMVGDINRAMPTMPEDSLLPFLADAFSRLRMAHTSRSWPPIAAFVKAMTAARKAVPELGRPAEYAPDDYAIAAAKMREGEPVGDGFIYGPKAKELEARGLVDAATLKCYRSSVFFKLREVYGPDAEKLEARIIAVHVASDRPTSDAALAHARAVRFTAKIKRMEKVEA